jgi:diguanylate cyclase
MPDHHQSTIAVGETALARIAALGQPADPRSYALWYQVATGDSGLLTAAVNKKLARSGALTAQDVEELHTTHVGPVQVSDKVDKLGARVADEIEQVMAMMDAAEGSASSYSADLSNASRRLGVAKDREGVRAIVEGLVLATKEIEAKNAKLQLQLHAMWEEMAQLRREMESIRAESLTDALTSLGNRKFFNGSLEKLIAECRAAGEPLSLLLADVDHFKAINDTFGHVVGDRVLRFVAMTMKDSITGKDIAARYGGEEFAVILPTTGLFPAVKLAEQIRHAVMKAELIKRSTGEKHTRLTISIGVATLHNATTAQALIEAADVCLYAAKRGGRNRVVSEADEQSFTAITR